MGSDETYTRHLSRICSQLEDLSSEILKKLKSYISDETVHAAVITIPAEFKVTATSDQKAGELAGLAIVNCCKSLWLQPWPLQRMVNSRMASSWCLISVEERSTARLWFAKMAT